MIRIDALRQRYRPQAMTAAGPSARSAQGVAKAARPTTALPGTVSSVTPEAVSWPGHSSDPATRRPMASHLGHHFGQVRVQASRRLTAQDGQPEMSRRASREDVYHPDAVPARVSSYVRSVLRAPGSGQQVPAGPRAETERARGVDLSAARLHTHPRAAAAAINVGAVAFSSGEHIFVSQEQERLQSAAGQNVLLHELNHVADFLLGMQPPGGIGAGPPIMRYPNQRQAGTVQDYLDIVRSVEATNPSVSPRATLEAVRRHIEQDFRGLTQFRYFETQTYGWIDIVHFTTAADMAADYGEGIVDVLGFGNEVVQWLTEWGSDYRSGFSPEDIPSNSAGSNFGDDVFDPEGDRLSVQLEAYLNTLQPIAPDSSTTYASLPATDTSGRPSGTSAAASRPASAGARCEPRYLGMGAYLGADCIVRQGPGPKL